jgi:plastocyanin
MSKSTLAAIIIAVIIIAGGALALTHNSSNNTPAPATNNTTQNKPAASSTNSNPVTATGSIDINNMMFTPSQITIAKGGTVTWTNNDSTAHTVTDDLSNVDGPASGDIQPGSTYSFTFNKTGSFQYHCSIHPYMRGTIVVK